MGSGNLLKSRKVAGLWQEIDLVMLDMDGTLLDRYFDDYFWEEHLPKEYAVKNRVSPERARSELLARYQAREGTLAWTDLDFWSDQLGLDIPYLKLQVEHLIAVHPYVIPFLEYCRALNKKIWLVTNAHSKTLDIKMAKTALRDHFDHIVCSLEVGVAKEDPSFWRRLREISDYNPNRTMLADDTEKVLDSAAIGGIRHLIFVARPSSRLEPKRSEKYNSIIYFRELMP